MYNRLNIHVNFEMGNIYVYTGEGPGKTTSALGVALRSIGHRKKVIIIQFLKWWKNTGEYLVKDFLKPYYEIYQFGVPGWIKIKGEVGEEVEIDGSKYKVRSITELDRIRAVEALKFAEEVALKKKPFLLILDEINLAIHLNLITMEEIVEFLEKLPKETHVILTGRYAPKELIEKAHAANRVEIIKMPSKMLTVEGINY